MAGYEIPWVEKYRPTYLNDVVGNEQAILQLRAIATQGNMPNIILVGPPGCGKTTSIMCLARELLGDCLRTAVCELNASDDRGIDVVREKIKSFAQQKVNVPENAHKIIILDEADAMTSSAQQALRMIMTDYTATTRFALACNDSSKIIEPIQSRCAVLRFTRLSDTEINARLRIVIEQEQIVFEERGIEAIVFTADGDMRQALNNLQATVAGYGQVTFDGVFEVCDQPHPDVLRNIIKHCLEGQFTTAAENLHVLWVQGYSPLDVIGSLYKIVGSYGMPEHIHLRFLKELAVLRMRLLDGVNSLLQVHGCLAKMSEIALAG